MSVAKVSEISATSTKSFEDAIQQGLARASKTLRNMRRRLDQGAAGALRRRDAISEYQVNMMVTFVIDD